MQENKDANELVGYELVDHVARLELRRVEALNSLDPHTGRAWSIAADRAAADVSSGAAKVVLVSASGRAFSVGGDLAQFAQASDRGDAVAETARGLHAGIATLRSVSAPVVSVIQGTAAGGGLGLGLIGDIVLAAEEAKLVLAYTTSGLSPDCGLSWVLPRRLTWPRAMDLLLLNRVLTGAEAAEWGLVSRAVPGVDLETTVDEVVSTLRDGPGTALAVSKRLMIESLDRTLGQQMDQEASRIASMMRSPHGIEGVDAFLAKRKPNYS